MDAKENLLRAIKRENPEYVPYYIPGEPELDEGIIQSIDYKGNFTGPGVEGIDCWGVHWIPTSGEGKNMVCHPKEFPLKKIEKIDNYQFPDPDKFELKEESKELLKKVNRKKVLLFGYQYYYLFERAWALTGMENLLVALYTEPKRIKKLLHGIANYQIGIAKHYLELGVDGCIVSEDLGNQRTLMMKPEIWREFFKPELKRMIQPYKDAGKIFWFHSCGHIMEIVEDLIEIGVDILHPVQARANNLKELKQKYGDRICFCGGIDTQYTLTRGTPEEVKEETIQRLKDLAPGGGYIAGPDQSMPFPKENIKTLVNTVKKYGKYPLKI